MNASGESYALPVRLVAKQGSIDVMPVTGSLVILANRHNGIFCFHSLSEAQNS